MIKRVSSSCELNDSDLQQARHGVEQLFARQDVGFWQCPSRVAYYLQSVERSQSIMQKKKRFVVVGIGGSSLGAKALFNGLKHLCRPPVSLLFLENVDPYIFASICQEGLSQTHFIVVSKSGGTLETLFLLEALLQNGVQPNDENFTVICEDAPSALAKWSLQHKILSLPIPNDVGGRFSVFTPVGILPLCLMGLNIQQFRMGQQKAIENKELICEMVADHLASFRRQEWVHVFWGYGDSFKDLGLWQQQLWAESLAKLKTRKGQPAPRVSTPCPLVGAVDQHSVLQQIMEGARDKFVHFISCQATSSLGPALTNLQLQHGMPLEGVRMGAVLNIEAQATSKALSQVGVSVVNIEFSALDEFNFGYYMMSLALLVGSLAEVLDINAYDQPGVELGKQLTKSILIQARS